MPTIHRRISILDSGEVARQIDAAALAWPGAFSRQQLARRLMAVGAEVAERERADEIARRLAALDQAAGLAQYPPGYLQAMADEWPS
ncbi:MAG: hypothetical protein LBG11_09360 [Bifidobacteriaceae bacterium]|nr:hypothetical protein [Bifidobacteriaceae bacterium]